MPPHVCKVCGKQLSRSTKLVEHERSHTGERPFQCSVCQAKFSRSYDLTKHKKVHSGTHKYVCRFIENDSSWGCGKGFHKKGDLNRHLGRYNARKCRKGLLTQTGNPALSTVPIHRSKSVPQTSTGVIQTQPSPQQTVTEDKSRVLSNDDPSEYTPTVLGSSHLRTNLDSKLANQQRMQNSSEVLSISGPLTPSRVHADQDGNKSSDSKTRGRTTTAVQVASGTVDLPVLQVHSIVDMHPQVMPGLDTRGGTMQQLQLNEHGDVLLSTLMQHTPNLATEALDYKLLHTSTLIQQYRPTTYTCYFCHLPSFGIENAQMRLKQMHGGGEPHRCWDCGKTTYSRHDSWLHYALHLRGQFFVCRSDSSCMATYQWGCGRTFGTVVNLYAHLNSIGGRVCLAQLTQGVRQNDLETVPEFTAQGALVRALRYSATPTLRSYISL